MPNVKVPTTFRCRWVPNRDPKRVFTALDAARIMCRVVRSGSSKASIELEYRRICRDEPQKRGTEALMALELAAEAINENTEELTNTFRVFQLLNGLLIGLAALALILPIARPVRIAAQAARVALAARMTANAVRRAANDEAFAIVQRAAANEARLLRAAGE